MTALEMAQFRIAQLSSELEANKEAQNIVLDTKESVMRSLARQNTELTLEVGDFTCWYSSSLPTDYTLLVVLVCCLSRLSAERCVELEIGGVEFQG